MSSCHGRSNCSENSSHHPKHKGNMKKRGTNNKQCFTPSTMDTKSYRTTTTATMSSGGSLSSRLPGDKKHAQMLSCGSCCSVASHRIEELYRVKVDKMRARPMSDREERAIRQRNVEERELKECTFRPQIRWRQESSSRDPRRQPREKTDNTLAPNLSLDDESPMHSSIQQELFDPTLPREIIVTTTAGNQLSALLHPHTRTHRRCNMRNLPVRLLFAEQPHLKEKRSTDPNWRLAVCHALETGSI